MLFDRLCAVEIGPPGGKGFRVEDLRVAFAVTKTGTQTANEVKVEIYNLAEASRGRIKEADHVCLVYAGYAEEAGLQLLAAGTITRVSHAFRPPDVVTLIEAGDGVKERREVRVSVSYGAGASGKRILADVAGRMGLVVRELPDVVDTTYAHGFSFSGQAREALDRVADRLGVEWSIQNRELQFVRRGQPNARRAILLSPSTGLLGSPEPVTDVGSGLKEVTEVRGWRATSLLMPTIEPHGRLQLDARGVKGLFRVDSVEHRGDTHGDEWQSVSEISDPNGPALTKKSKTADDDEEDDAADAA